ncbi:MAG: hypothetical protein P4L55_11410 [Syntrophobacteraceae bacterium]|nr:hypothetical protein [Syntrophobacteraceae bacterium]
MQRVWADKAAHGGKVAQALVKVSHLEGDLGPEKISLRNEMRDAVFQGLRIFADSRTVGNVPVRDSNITLARSLSRLVDLSDSLLESCPFLSRSEGIYAAFIPGKYWIDVRRAQEILDRCLSKWLSMADGSAEEEALRVKGGMKL